MGRSVIGWIIGAVLGVLSTAWAIPVFQEKPGDNSLSRLWLTADDLVATAAAEVQGQAAPDSVVVVVVAGQSKAFRISTRPGGEALWYNSKVWFRLRDLINLGIPIEITGDEIKISGKSLRAEFISEASQPVLQASQTQVQTATAAKNCGTLRLFEVVVPDYLNKYVARMPLAILVSDLQTAARCMGVAMTWDSTSLILSLAGQTYSKSRYPLSANSAIPVMSSYLIGLTFPEFSVTSNSTVVYFGKDVKANFQLRFERIDHPILAELRSKAVEIIDKKADRASSGYATNIVCAFFDLSCSVQGSTLSVNGQSIAPGQTGYDRGTFYVAGEALAPFVPLFEGFEADSDGAVTSIADIRATRNTRRSDLSNLAQISVSNQTFISLSSILGSNVDGGVKISNTTVSFPKSAFGAGLANIPLWTPKSDGDLYAVLLDSQFMTKAAIPSAMSESRVRYQVYIPVRLVSKVYSRIAFDADSLALKVILDELSDGIYSIPISQVSKRGNYTVTGLKDLITTINTSIAKQKSIDAANQRAAEAEARKQAAELEKIYQRSKPVIQLLITALGGSASSVDGATYLGEGTYAYHNRRGAVIWQVGLSGVEMCSLTWLLNVVVLNAQPFYYLGRPALLLYTNYGTAIAWVDGTTTVCPYIF